MDQDEIAEGVSASSYRPRRSVNRADEMILERRVSPFGQSSPR